MTGPSCSDCVKLQIENLEKDAEIKKLTFQIQKLTENLKLYESQSCLKCFCSTEIRPERNEKCAADDDKTLPVSLFSPKTEDKSEKTGNPTDIEKSNVEDRDQNVDNKFQSSDEYVYDESYQMYYCVSTGYYYDKNTGLYYVPQNGAYYTYDYSENAYVLYDGHKTATDVINSENKNPTSEVNHNLVDDINKVIESNSDSCESVVNQVNNLNINDVNCSVNNSDTLAAEHVLTTETYDTIKDNTICLKSQENESHSSFLNVWETAAGSKQTIQDLVREVAEQYSGVSDYVYDEKYQMYYSTSTGYYYDSVRKLLYDPRNGIYYKYDEDTSSYDFYYQVDLNAVKAEEKVKQTTLKVKARRRYWRKKLAVHEEKCSNSPKHLVKIDNQEENYSSPEEGELFSSESEQETESQSETHPGVENNYSPCIRAIVKESTKLKIGSLILITCSGAIIGREKSNDVHIPEIGVSKIHAEVSFNNELWKYIIKDLGSQNGTFVNDTRLSDPKELSSPCVLNHGDIISIGSCKLMFHIHVRYETCDECEPGQVMAEKPLKEEKSTLIYKTKEEIEKLRKQELRRLKKKYGLEGMGYEGGKNSALTSGYEDKAEERRKTVGSENPYEKIETASLERAVNESNKGYQMLKKLGWKDGDSLGVTGLGISEPIPLRPWLSKAGLGSSEEQQALLAVTQNERNKKWVLAQERFLKLS